MGLIRVSDPNLVVNLSNKTFGDTVIKRKAELIDLLYSTIKKRVAIEVRISVYAKAVDANGDETYGQPLNGVQGFSDYTATVTANMSELVDSVSGTTIGSATLLMDPSASAPATTDEQGHVITPAGILYGKNYMYEYEWYKMIGSSQPVIIEDMIIGKIKEADLTGKF